MASLTHQLLVSVTIVLSVVQFIDGYSFKNCIEDPYWNTNKTDMHTKFSCSHRKEKSMYAIIHDLPPSALNLNISSNPISHIPDKSFVHLPNLEYLKMDHNILTTIDELAFQNLYHLKSLNLSFNYISELDPSLFKDLNKLTFLSLTGNKLKQLPVNIFSRVFNLDTLILRQNFLTNFSGVAESVSQLMNLSKLDLCFNQFKSLSHSNVLLPKSLTILYLCRNYLTTLACEPSFLRRIELLDLSYNSQLPSIAFKGVDLSQINYLRLRATNVRVSELFNVSNVKVGHVDFSGMGLKNDSLLIELCRLLRGRVNCIKDLKLGSNGIKYINYTLSGCPDIKGAVDLSRNQLKSIGCLDFLKGQKHIQSFIAEHNHLTSLQSCKKENMLSFHYMKELSYRYNRILSVSSFAFHHTPNIKTLKLNINTIAFLHRNALKGLKSLETLRLDNNLLTDLFNVSFEDLYNLQILNLRNNRISVIFNGTFLSLSSLTTLDLGGNKITHFQPSGLDGLKNLSKLYLDGNNLKQIDSEHYCVFQDTLKVLDLQRNQISLLSEHISVSPFMNLSKLHDLKLDGQMPYGITLLPRAFFRGLRSLKSLYLTNNHITYLAPDAFDDLSQLRFLTLGNSCAGVVQLQPGVFKNLRNLTKLIVENMGIQNFSKEVFGNLTKLHILQLNHNVMQSIDVDVLETLSNLRYLDIRNIPLSCTCQNRILQNWTVNNPNVQLIYLKNLPCQDNKKFKFHNFDTKVCYIDLGEYLFFTTAAVIFLFTVIPLLYVKLYWKMKYSYYVFRAWFSEQWRRLREEEENCKYDAFVSYNSSDEHWILDQLLPNLEGNGSSFKLCLHHRDFELGRDIVSNIVSAVYGSRKTICVVSRNFLQSEWCSLEIQLASYRLFDEHRDVLLLVFLEPIPERQLSSYHRMRKIMLKKTYLQWPGSDCTDPAQAQDLFWNQLRRALRKASRLDNEEENYRNEGCAIADREDTEYFVNQTSDENYYLLP
ncbi:toll-like receptor 21 [Centroberyx affinis]|uniref:toll-like receptor 21 n=1 Tax=Centroberyx affinis TaxID=166261 RepID=UPI003A5BA185